MILTQNKPFDITSLNDWSQSFPSLLIFALTVVLVIIGWRVIYGNAKKIARRAEVKANIETIYETLYELLDEALVYYTEVEKFMELENRPTVNTPMMSYEQRATLLCSKVKATVRHLVEYNVLCENKVTDTEALQVLATKAPSLVQVSKESDRAYSYWTWFYELKTNTEELALNIKEVFIGEFVRK